MRCEQVQELLALWAAGDLKATDTLAVDSHLAACSACEELALAWQQDLEAVKSELSAAGGAVPDEKSLEVAVAAAVAQREARVGRRAGWPGRVATAVAALLVFMLVGHFMATDLAVDERPLIAEPDVAVTWSDLQDFFDDCLTEPVPVDQWRGEPEGGVLAVLVRTGDRGRYEVAASLEVADMASIRSYPWLAQRLRRLQLEAGLDGQLVITSCGTGRLDRASRRRLEREFRAEFVVASND
jgi:hypothetical protein